MQSLYMLNMVRWPWGRLNCKTMTLLEPSKCNCAHELESSATFTNMTDLLVALSVRCEDGYIVCHLEFTFVLPNISIYGSCSRSRSQSLCTGELIKSKCALSDLFRFCCHNLSLVGFGSVSRNIEGC